MEGPPLFGSRSSSPARTAKTRRPRPKAQGFKRPIGDRLPYRGGEKGRRLDRRGEENGKCLRAMIEFWMVSLEEMEMEMLVDSLAVGSSIEDLGERRLCYEWKRNRKSTGNGGFSLRD